MKAMIFAAGVGSRLKDETSQRPKCLVEVAGKSLLEHVVERLKGCGVTDVMINVHHFSEMIIDFVETRKHFEIKISFSHEGSLLDTGGGIYKVRDFFAAESDFLIHNCDIYCDYPLSELLAKHRKEKPVATLLTRSGNSGRGLYFDRKNRLTGWSEDPSLLPNHTDQLRGFCGIHVATPQVFSFMSDEPEKFSIIKAYLNAVRAGSAVVGQDIGDRYWIDVGKPSQLQELRSRLDAQR